MSNVKIKKTEINKILEALKEAGNISGACKILNKCKDTPE